MIYVSKQFMGPNITGFMNAIESYFNTKYKLCLQYLINLSITTANEKHTEMIGRLIGFPRPLVQEEVYDSSSFRLTLSYYTDEDIGFSLSYNNTGGGLLSDVTDDNNLVYLALATYKEMLKLIAFAKSTSGRYSLSLVDSVCSAVIEDGSYIIEYVGPANDLLITFYSVNVYAIYIAGYVLNYLFDSVPSITVTKEQV